MYRRMFSLLCIFCALFFLYWGRLFWLQILAPVTDVPAGANALSPSLRQRSEEVVLDPGRGHFYDRHGHPITGFEMTGALFFPLPQSLQNPPWLLEVADILKIPPERLGRFLQNLKAPAFFPQENSRIPLSLSSEQIRSLEALDIPYLFALPTVTRYPEPMAAAHLIGFLGENDRMVRSLYPEELKLGRVKPNEPVGVAGLEKTLEKYLHGWLPKEAYLYVDGRRQVLEGLGLKTGGGNNPYYPTRAILTLDLDIQESVEKLLEERKIEKGAVVVLDADNGDVLAMASRPPFHPLRIPPDHDDWSNRALKALPPGSVFKAAVAAVLLDGGLIDERERFYCGGSLQPYSFSCWKEGGHGWLTAREAFAQSCNVAFAQMMKRVDSDKFEQMALKLGLGRTVGWTETLNGKPWKQLDGEEAGRIFHESADKQDIGVKIQTAIGQRDVRMTPLQAANLVVTLLNGGTPVRPRAVKEIQYQNGAVKKEFAEKSLEPGRAIMEKSAHKVAAWMTDVVQNGTARSLSSNVIWPVAGKTGTAEAEEGKVHQWFIGFGPANRPQYAVCVVVESVPENSPHLATTLFGEVMDILAKKEQA